jgi:invasion protein IalB
VSWTLTLSSTSSTRPQLGEAREAMSPVAFSLSTALCQETLLLSVIMPVLLPEAVAIFGGTKFDVNVEFAVTVAVVAICLSAYCYAHFFLDENLQPKSKVMATNKME